MREEEILLFLKLLLKLNKSVLKKDVNKQHGLSRGWKNERLAVKRMKVTGQFADKLRAHVVYTSCLGKLLWLPRRHLTYLFA